MTLTPLRTFGAAAAILALSLAAACGSSTSDADSGSGDGQDAKLGVLLRVPNSWNQAWGENFEAAAAQLGISRVSVQQANIDAQTQLTQFKQLLNQGYKGIAINSLPEQNTPELVKLAAEHDAYVFTAWDTAAYTTPLDPELSKHWVRSVMPNLVQGGEGVVDELAKALGGKGDVVTIAGTSAGRTAALGDQGIKNGLAKHPGLKVLGNLDDAFVVEDGQKKAADLLARYPSTKAIITVAGPSAEGAVAAIRAAGKVPGKDVFVASVIEEGPVVDYIEQGLVVAAGATPPAATAALAAADLYDAINGVTIPSADKSLWWTSTIITQDNAAAYLERYEQDPGQATDARLASQKISGDAWDLQAGYVPVEDYDLLYIGTKRPSGWTPPGDYAELEESGGFADASQRLAAHNKIGTLDAFTTQ